MWKLVICVTVLSADTVFQSVQWWSNIHVTVNLAFEVARKCDWLMKIEKGFTRPMIFEWLAGTLWKFISFGVYRSQQLAETTFVFIEEDCDDCVHSYNSINSYSLLFDLIQLAAEHEPFRPILHFLFFPIFNLSSFCIFSYQRCTFTSRISSSLFPKFF